MNAYLNNNNEISNKKLIRSYNLFLFIKKKLFILFFRKNAA